MFATLSTAWVLPGLIGPAIAGSVGETFGWRYVFLGLLPLIAIAGALTLGALRAVAPAPAVTDPETARARRGRLPLAMTVSFGAGLFLVGLTSDQALATVPLTRGRAADRDLGAAAPDAGRDADGAGRCCPPRSCSAAS